MDAQLAKISKFLSYVLRHCPESIGLTLDKEGWANIDQLIELAGQNKQPLDRDTLIQVVDTNDKKRFSLSDDGLRIRAAQGHSSQQVAISYTPVEPPPRLYHGTATRFLVSIKEQGLRPGSRQHVHLSADEKTATTVGSRHGVPVVLTIDAAAMQAQGFQFFQADNGVWLTENVPVAYIRD